MGLDNFKYLGDFKNECIHCGAIVDSGIINLLKHEDRCEDCRVQSSEERAKAFEDLNLTQFFRLFSKTK